MREKLLLALLCCVLAGCASSEQILLTAAPDQQAIVRDGIPALISHKKHLVMLRPNNRLVKSGARPAFTLVVRNQGQSPETLFEASISASQTLAGKSAAVRVYRYDELVQEEQTRQAMAAVGAALAGAGRAMSAANAGYVNTTGSFNAYRPGYGTAYGTYSSTTYDPLRAQIAQQAANAETTADFAALRAQGESNLMSLQQTILKDNTVMPGEWYGGSIVLDAPEKTGNEMIAYSIVVIFAGEEHVFSISHVKG
ncbi:hypothetical protein W911_14640 [Hyphomicrobium nitrativorans NL23]|uniref:Lipoprotein n=1 Tax=Hyphomicrobium nitrativorans NL23 TaxID=1029756 RepID=V5SJU2_9HYPH|nr:hypothetical protein [Hyphomicrobium nitrativorans]AHB50350.1 hypothetical protein W911_14640 [Hyphomicrobium nitrativorans NL23]